MLRTIFLVAIAAFSSAAEAAPFIASYKTAAGAYQTPTIASELTQSGSPAVAAYKDGAGNWHSTTIIENICGLDKADAPVICNPLSSNMINVDYGIAGLDANGNITQAVFSPQATVSPSVGGAATAFFQGFSGDLSAIGGGYDETLIGGIAKVALSHSPYGASYAQPGHLLVTGAPSGPFDGGFTLGLYNEPVTHPQMAISGADYRGGFVSTQDAVEFQQGMATEMARLILPVASYTATTAVLSNPLTAAEASQLHAGMYITTNSVQPGATQVGFGDPSLNGDLPPFQNYHGNIVSVSKDGTTITVNGWARDSQQGGAVPNTSSLDTVYDNRTGAVVYIGMPSKEFAHNLFGVYDGSRTSTPGTNASSLVHQFENEEIDEEVNNVKAKNEVSWHGSTYTTNANYGQLSADSYHIALAGGQMNDILLEPQWWTTIVNGLTFYVGQPQGPAQTAGATSVLAAFAGSTNTGPTTWSPSHMVRTYIYNTRNAADDGQSYQNITTSIGVGVDGGSNAPSQIQEHIELNPKSNNNGIGLCSYGEADTSCALYLTGNGNVQMPNGVATNGQINLIKGGWLNFADRYGNEGGWIQPPNGSDTTGGTPVNQIDVSFPQSGGLLSIHGGITASNQLSASNVSALGSPSTFNFVTSNYGYIGPLQTPASSAAACSAGQFEDDANFHYVCVDTNHWRRVALTDF